MKNRKMWYVTVIPDLINSCVFVLSILVRRHVIQYTVSLYIVPSLLDLCNGVTSPVCVLCSVVDGARDEPGHVGERRGVLRDDGGRVAEQHVGLCELCPPQHTPRDVHVPESHWDDVPPQSAPPPPSPPSRPSYASQ